MSNSKKDSYDTTGSKRGSAHLDRLIANKGKRIPLDLDAKSVEQVKKLLTSGYGSSMAAVIRKAIDEASENLPK